MIHPHTLLKFQHIEPVKNRDAHDFMLFFSSHFSYLMDAPYLYIK